MTIVFPNATKSQGATSLIAVQTITTLTAPKIATELNATTSVNASCYAYGSFDPTATTNKGNPPPRLCTTVQFEQFGLTSFAIPDIQYVYNPQAADTDPANKVKSVLVEGTTVYFVIRRGLNAQASALAVGQFVDVFHVRLGPQNRGTTGTDEYSEFAITQSAIALEPPTYGAILAA